MKQRKKNARCILYSWPWQDGEEEEASDNIAAFKGGQIKKQIERNRFHSFQNSSQEQEQEVATLDFNLSFFGGSQQCSSCDFSYTSLSSYASHSIFLSTTNCPYSLFPATSCQSDGN
jgi:hypothetical protein